MGRYTKNLTDGLLTCKHGQNGSPITHFSCVLCHCAQLLNQPGDKSQIQNRTENVSLMALRHFPVRLIQDCCGGYRPPYPPPCRFFGTNYPKNALIQNFANILPGALQSAHTSLLWTFLDISPRLLQKRLSRLFLNVDARPSQERRLQLSDAVPNPRKPATRPVVFRAFTPILTAFRLV